MKNKKVVTALLLILIISVISIIGFTMAYFTSQTDFENEFQTGLYQTTATEVFESPENWLPGDETPKTLTITNTGNVNVKARVCISEEWISSNNNSLPLEQNGERVAIINLDNTSDWTKEGNCYEYNDVLKPEDVTSSFMSSVTFNPNATAGLNCVPTTSNGTITNTCTSNGNGYDNATYKLTLTVETIQANKADEEWLIDYYGSNITYPWNEPYVKLDQQISDGIRFYNSLEEFVENDAWAIEYIFLKYRVRHGILKECYVGIIVDDELSNMYPNLVQGTYYIGIGGATKNEEQSQLMGRDIYNNDSIYYESNKNVLEGLFQEGSCSSSNNTFQCSENNNPFCDSDITKSGEVTIRHNSNFVCHSTSYGISCATTD